MNICVIGVGRMGRRHITVIQRLGYKIAGIVDINQEAMQLVISECQVAENFCYSSVEEMLKETHPTIVVVATTAPSHCKYVCIAAAAGVKYILCEKPMATSIAECNQMINECEKYGAILAVNHQMRFMEQYTKIKVLCESQEFGGLRSITIAASNFGLAMNGSHYFEMFKFMTDHSITEISFRMDTEKVPNPRGSLYEDYSGQIFALTDSSHRLYMEIGGDQGHGIHVIYGCRNGQIFVDELAGHVRTIVRQKEYQHLPTTQYGLPAHETIFNIAPADVIQPTQAVLQSLIDEHNYPDSDCARRVVMALVGAHISGENSGQMIKLNNNLPKERQFFWA